MSNTPILDLPQLATNQQQPEITVNDAILGLENATQGLFTVLFSQTAATQTNTQMGVTGLTMTLTQAQLVSAFVFAVSGQSAAATLTIPLQSRYFFIRNTGSNTVTVTGGSGTTVTVAATSSAVLYCDGTNIYSVIGGTTTGYAGVPVEVIAASGASQVLTLPSVGDICYLVTLTANCTFSLAGGSANQLQTIILILQQASGGTFTWTHPANVNWPGGTTPTPDTATNVVSVFKYTTPNQLSLIVGSYMA